MKQTECPNCGAVFDAKETRCPYCSYINPEGAEAKYLKDLEDSRRNLDAVDDQVRSGYRKEIRKGAGTALKTVLIIALILAVVIGGFIYALFGPLPEGEGGDFFISLYDWWTEFSFGKGAMWLYFGIAVFLWITIIGYYLSYRLSCKLYLKGVELYDK